MKTIQIAAAFVVALLVAGCEKQQPVATTTTQEAANLAFAQQQAFEEKKLVLLEFTGSDWCPPCMRMHKEVLTRPEFEAYAKTNLIYVELDFPRSKPQSDEVKKANEGYAEQFKIEAFPTYVLLNGAGEEIWREEGAFAQNVQEFIAALEKAGSKVAR